MKSEQQSAALSQAVAKGDIMNGYGMGMYGWNTGWMWVIGLLVVVVLVLLLRARK